MPETPLLIIAASESDSNLYYATRFLAPDAFVYLRDRDQSMLLMSDLEMDRAKAQAKVDTVLSYTTYEERAKAKMSDRPRVVHVVRELLNERGIKAFDVPASFPIEYGDMFRGMGFTVGVRPDPLFPERVLKQPQEVEAISATQRAVEEAVAAAMQLLRDADVRNGLLYADGAALTSERIKQLINVKLMERDCVAQHTIVACGVDACDPHNEGSGPLLANQPIIFDVFPRSSHSRYFADMSRTVVKGRASDGMKRLYEAVLEGQEWGAAQVKAGVDGQSIHQGICDRFKAKGYETGLKDGRMQGFFHGTGHGVGIDIHEAPRVSKVSHVLQPGEVVTIEPGLYYPAIGAARIEDMVLVTADGGVNLTRFPKTLEL
ncbi:MAG TPA: M24 family metallopeptidase [Nitrospiria bacterium]|nr:M24 family metallopeptidase [Nitrospiria bacterium]